MPIVHVNVWEGFGKEKTKTVIQNITKVFVDMDIPKQAVSVIVHEIPKTHWGIGGEPSSVKFDNIWGRRLLVPLFVGWLVSSLDVV